MPIQIDQRKRPAGVKVHLTTGEGVEGSWAAGHGSRYGFPYLRDHCPCAVCNDEREKNEQLALKSGGATVSPVLPMYKPRVTAKKATAVGSYAIQIEFSDGHA